MERYNFGELLLVNVDRRAEFRITHSLYVQGYNENPEWFQRFVDTFGPDVNAESILEACEYIDIDTGSGDVNVPWFSGQLLFDAGCAYIIDEDWEGYVSIASKSPLIKLESKQDVLAYLKMANAFLEVGYKQGFLAGGNAKISEINKVLTPVCEH